MWVMWLKLEGALIIFERRSVFLWNNPSVNSFGQSDWNWQSTKYLIKHGCSKLFSFGCVKARLRCVSVNVVSVTKFGELCDGVLAD